MLCKNIFRLTLCVSLAALISSLDPFVQAQTRSGEDPRLIDYGPRLRPQKGKSEDKSKENIATNPANEDDVIKIDTNLVKTDVLVIDERGNAVLGLKKEDFIVTENGVEQKIEHFSLGDSVDVPRSIVLIIDYSESQRPLYKNQRQSGEGPS